MPDPIQQDVLQDSEITTGLIRSAWTDVFEAGNHLRTICRPRVPDTELHWVDEALAQIDQAKARLDMAIPGGLA